MEMFEAKKKKKLLKQYKTEGLSYKKYIQKLCPKQMLQ